MGTIRAQKEKQQSCSEAFEVKSSNTFQEVNRVLGTLAIWASNPAKRCQGLSSSSSSWGERKVTPILHFSLSNSHENSSNKSCQDVQADQRWSIWSAETFVASTFEECNDAYALWTVLSTSAQTVRPWTRCAHMLQLVNCPCFHSSSLNCTAASFLATNPPPKLEVQHAKLLYLHHTAFYHNAAIISTDIVHVGPVFTTASSKLLLLHIHSLLNLLNLHPLWQIKSH